MTPRPVLRRVAQAELDEAIAWYDLQNSGLGLALLAAINDALTAITEQPTRWPVFHRDIHRYLVGRFPYLIY